MSFIERISNAHRLRSQRGSLNSKYFAPSHGACSEYTRLRERPKQQTKKQKKKKQLKEKEREENSRKTMRVLFSFPRLL